MDGQTNEEIVLNWLNSRSKTGLINIIMGNESARKFLLNGLIGEEE